MDDTDVKNRGWKILNWRSLSSPPEWLAAFAYIATFFVVAAILVFIIIPTLYKVALLVSFGNPSSDDLRAALLGVGAILATPFVIWRLWTSHISALSAQKQASIAADTLANTTFSKAVEQLGAMRTQGSIGEDRPSKNLETRLGAIFTLTELANTESRFHFSVVETLAAYIRENSKRGNSLPYELPAPTHIFEFGSVGTTYEQKVREWLDNEPKLSSDILAALYSLSILSSDKKRDGRLDLSNVSIRNSELQWLKFSHVTLDSSQLECTVFVSIFLNDVLFQNVRANCCRFFSGKLENCFFKNSCFNSSGFDGLEIIDTRFIGTEFCSASMAGTRFLGCLLNSCNVTKAYFRSAKFIACDLDSLDFLDCELTDAEFTYSKLDQVCFQKKGSYLSSAFGQTSFSKQTWGKVDGVKFDMAWISQVDLSVLENITQDIVDQIYFADETVIIPVGLDRPRQWNDRLMGAGDMHSLHISWRRMRQNKFGIVDTFLSAFDVIDN